MKQYMMTYHAACERLDRLTLIATHIGWGEVVLEYVDYEQQARISITNTGILIVKSYDGSSVVTAYPARPLKLVSIYKAQGYVRVPQYLFEKAAKNEHIMRKYGCH